MVELSRRLCVMSRERREVFVLVFVLVVLSGLSFLPSVGAQNPATAAATTIGTAAGTTAAVAIKTEAWTGSAGRSGRRAAS